MKFFLMTDLEGVAGVASFDSQTYPQARYYEDAKRLLTAEVNAAITGLLQAGVTDVLVLDGHGPGGICFAELHPQARLIHGRPLSPTWLDLLADRDALGFVGQHAMAGVPTGNLHHTQSSQTIEYITLNGEPIGEIAQLSLYAGSLGVPTIFLSGDDMACREIETLIPGLTTVEVQHGLSRTSAVSLSAAKSRALIQAGAKAAVESHQLRPLAPPRRTAPYVVETRFFTTTMAETSYSRRRDAVFVDGRTVRVTSDNIREVIYG